MLFHFNDLSRALCEISRVLNRGGKFYAATNGERHMAEVQQLNTDSLGVVPRISYQRFSLENGGEQLANCFSHVQRFDFEDNLAVTEVEPLVEYI